MTAAVIMTMEPVFAAGLAVGVAGGAPRCWLGGVLVVASMGVAEVGARECCDGRTTGRVLLSHPRPRTRKRPSRAPAHRQGAPGWGETLAHISADRPRRPWRCHGDPLGSGPARGVLHGHRRRRGDDSSPRARHRHRRSRAPRGRTTSVRSRGSRPTSRSWPPGSSGSPSSCSACSRPCSRSRPAWGQRGPARRDGAPRGPPGDSLVPPPLRLGVRRVEALAGLAAAVVVLVLLWNPGIPVVRPEAGAPGRDPRRTLDLAPSGTRVIDFVLRLAVLAGTIALTPGIEVDSSASLVVAVVMIAVAGWLLSPVFLGSRCSSGGSARWLSRCSPTASSAPGCTCLQVRSPASSAPWSRRGPTRWSRRSSPGHSASTAATTSPSTPCGWPSGVTAQALGRPRRGLRPARRRAGAPAGERDPRRQHRHQSLGAVRQPHLDGVDRAGALDDTGEPGGAAARQQRPASRRSAGSTASWAGSSWPAGPRTPPSSRPGSATAEELLVDDGVSISNLFSATHPPRC